MKPIKNFSKIDKQTFVYTKPNAFGKPNVLNGNIESVIMYKGYSLRTNVDVFVIPAVPIPDTMVEVHMVWETNSMKVFKVDHNRMQLGSGISVRLNEKSLVSLDSFLNWLDIVIPASISKIK